MHKIKNLPKFFLFMVAAAILFSAGSASAVEKPRQGADILLDTYHRNMATLEKNSFGLPLFLESFERDDRVHVDVYGIFDYPFSSVVNVLKVPANWCDIVSLHPNVKACTYRELPGAWELTFYIGRKVYQPPEDTRQVIFNYRNVDQQQGYLGHHLHADAGPFGTKDHRMRFEALPLDGGRSLCPRQIMTTATVLRCGSRKRSILRPLARTRSGSPLPEQTETATPSISAGPAERLSATPSGTISRFRPS